jgi:hypothetical protein
VITEVIRKVDTSGNLLIQAISSTLQKFTAISQWLPFQKFAIVSDSQGTKKMMYHFTTQMMNNGPRYSYPIGIVLKQNLGVSGVNPPFKAVQCNFASQSVSLVSVSTEVIPHTTGESPLTDVAPPTYTF